MLVAGSANKRWRDVFLPVFLLLSFLTFYFSLLRLGQKSNHDLCNIIGFLKKQNNNIVLFMYHRDVFVMNNFFLA